MKKLLAMLTVGGVLALTTGCPPAPSTAPPPPTKTPPVVTGTSDHKTPDKTPDTTKTPDKTPDTTKTPDKTPDTTKTPDKTPDTTKTPDKTPEATKTPDKTPDAPKTETGKVEKGKLMVDGKEVTVPASVKDDLKNIKDGSEVTVTMDKDGKVTKVEEKK